MNLAPLEFQRPDQRPLSLQMLSMLYPRLMLARQLIHMDGVIFISIDDNEVHHLRMINGWSVWGR
jgi:adenine specific DNA methylase Mod